MISRLIPPLALPASGAASARATKQTGIPDFGAMLAIDPVVEHVPFGSGKSHSREQSAQDGIKNPGFPANTSPSVDGDVAIPRVVGPDVIIAGVQPSVLALPALQIPLRPQASAADPILHPLPAPHGILIHESAATLPGKGASLPNIEIADPARQQPADPIVPSADAISEWVPQASLSNAAPQVERIDAGTIGERIELVSMPWRLQANAGLSYRTIEADVQGDQDVGVGEETPVLPETNPLVHGQLFTFASIGEAASIADWLDSLQLLANSPEHVRSTADLTPTTEATDFTPAETLTSLVWPERLLRWLADTQGRGTTAWIRDYQINPSHAGQMIDALRVLAEQQGLPLRRVMLNGHELWHSAATPEITPRG